MQRSLLIRVIAVILVGFGMLMTLTICIPSSPALGHDIFMPTVGSIDNLLPNHALTVNKQVNITESASTTPTTLLTETALLTATNGLTTSVEMTPTPTITLPTITPTPTEEPTETSQPTQATPQTVVTTQPTPGTAGQNLFSSIIGLAKAQPLIPLGMLFVFLICALALILITAQRKMKADLSQTKDAVTTAPLLNKVIPAHERAYLRLKDQPDVIFPLAVDDVRIGRSPDNTIIITSEMNGAETVSRYHARLYRLERWILEDLDSSNGTYVNGQRTGRNYLQNGWEISIGGVTFTFHTGKVEG